MKTLGRKFNKLVIGSIVEDIIFIIFGLIMIAKPGATNEFAVRLFGFVSLIGALFSLIRFVYRKVALHIFKYSLPVSILKFIIGVVAVVKPTLLGNILGISVGFIMVANGLNKLYYSFMFYHQKEEIWNLTGVMSILIIAMGVVLVVNPFGAMVLITRIVGVFTICYAVFDTMQWMLLRKRCLHIISMFK